MKKLLDKLVCVAFRRQRAYDTYKNLKTLQKIPDNSNDDSFSLATPEIENKILSSWLDVIKECDSEIKKIKKEILHLYQNNL